MTDFDRQQALCYLAGYAPDALIHALDEMDRQQLAFKCHMSAGDAGISDTTATNR
jgi:hypothetical protein